MKAAVTKDTLVVDLAGGPHPWVPAFAGRRLGMGVSLRPNDGYRFPYT